VPVLLPRRRAVLPLLVEVAVRVPFLALVQGTVIDVIVSGRITRPAAAVVAAADEDAGRSEATIQLAMMKRPTRMMNMLSVRPAALMTTMKRLQTSGKVGL